MILTFRSNGGFVGEFFARFLAILYSTAAAKGGLKIVVSELKGHAATIGAAKLALEISS
jgi:hypothetical protein